MAHRGRCPRVIAAGADACPPPMPSADAPTPQWAWACASISRRGPGCACPAAEAVRCRVPPRARHRLRCVTVMAPPPSSHETRDLYRKGTRLPHITCYSLQTFSPATPLQRTAEQQAAPAVRGQGSDQRRHAAARRTPSRAPRPSMRSPELVAGPQSLLGLPGVLHDRPGTALTGRPVQPEPGRHPGAPGRRRRPCDRRTRSRTVRWRCRAVRERAAARRRTDRGPPGEIVGLCAQLLVRPGAGGREEPGHRAQQEDQDGPAPVRRDPETGGRPFGGPHQRSGSL